MTDIVREQFEHHIRKGIWGEDATTEPCSCLYRQAQFYEDRAIERDWQIWKASRDAILVTLPELKADSDADDIAGVGLVIPMFDRGYDEALEEARVAIESVGIRVEFEE